MIKARLLKVKSIDNEEIIMAMTMAKTINSSNNENNHNNNDDNEIKIGNQIKI